MDEKKRSRKKQLYHDIVKQVEFYFSAANLSKDRFMTHALAENEDGIELTVLMTFNKLKVLTADVGILTKALRLSELLQLTDNETRVKSRSPYKRKENEEDCTIYVERLPLDANIDFMKQVFSPFGQIDYVSLPKFHNGKIKGFGFVEFADPSTANKTVEEFKRTGGYLSIDMAPGNLRSICTFDKKAKEKLFSPKFKNFDYDEMAPRDDDEMNDVADEIENVEIAAETTDVDIATETADVDVAASTADVDTDDNDKKRKHKTSPSTLERKRKRIKSESNDDNLQSDVPDPAANAAADHCLDSSLDSAADKSADKIQDVEKVEESQDEVEMSDQVDDQQDDCSQLKGKKKRRQKKKAKKDRMLANSGLLILSKADWKKLRNKYLNVQWEKMKSLKKHLHKCKEMTPFEGHLADNGSGDTGGAEPSCVEVPDSVVKLVVEQPVVDVKAFKAQVKLNCSDVVNIDLKEGAVEIHLRFNTADSAARFVAGDNKWKGHLVTGEEEEKYWLKIHQDREDKKTKRSKKTQPNDEQRQGVDGSTADDMNRYTSKALKDKPSLDILPGTVVKIRTIEPIVNIKQFKNDVKMSCQDVIYVDAKEGTSEAFVRFKTADKARLFSSDSSHGKGQILSGEEEQLYWEKINEDRTNKFNKSVRINKRGKQKIIKKAEKIMGKHILFDDSDNMIISHAD